VAGINAICVQIEQKQFLIVCWQWLNCHQGDG